MHYGLNSLRAKVKRVLKDPIANVVLNYSIEKAKEYYDKASIQWEQGDYQGGARVDVHETETFPFANLGGASVAAKQAENLYNNMKADNKPYLRKLDWYLYGQNFVVSWHRMKTFEEYLHDGIKDALTSAYKDAESGARLLLEKELGVGIVSHQAIHCFAEGIIDEKTLDRLSHFEPATKFTKRDVEKDIEDCIAELNYRIDEKNKQCGTLAKPKTSIKAVEVKLEAESKEDEDELPKVIQEIMSLISKYVKNG